MFDKLLLSLNLIMIFTFIVITMLSILRLQYFWIAFDFGLLYLFYLNYKILNSHRK